MLLIVKTRLHPHEYRNLGQHDDSVKRVPEPFDLVPGGRVELPLSRENRILSPARLPVPPSGQGVGSIGSAGSFSNMTPQEGQSTSPLFFAQTCLLEWLRLATVETICRHKSSNCRSTTHLEGVAYIWRK